MNKVILIGRLTKDVEARSYGNDGKEFMSFTLAVNDMKETDFVPCVAFGKTGEIIKKYTSKGSQVAIEGSYKTKKVNDKYYTNVNVNNVELLGSKNDSESDEKPSYQKKEKYTKPEPIEPDFKEIDNDEFYETSKGLAVEEDLPF